MISNEHKKVLSKLQALCAKKEYCLYDIRKKAIESLDGNNEAVEEVIASLVEDKFVDDQRYAIAFARDKAALSGWGPIKIRYALRTKMISSEVINLALEEISQTKALEKLDKILETKARSLESDPHIKFKLIKFALTRGYEYDTVAEAIAKLRV